MIRILLVDDDPLVLQVTGLILRKAGHAVTTAPSGDAALVILAKDGCDMLITDHAMSGLSGIELIEHALRRWPALPALVISGYAKTQDWLHLPARVALLRKPFGRDAILAWVAAERPSQPQEAAS